jgi:hypothetical protein
MRDVVNLQSGMGVGGEVASEGGWEGRMNIARHGSIHLAHWDQ